MDSVAAVLFDLDDTLCVSERGTDELLAAAFEATDVPACFGGDEYLARFHEFAEMGQPVAVGRKRCFAALAEERGRDPAEGEAVADVYSRLRDPTRVRPCPGAIETLDRLADRYPLGLITNGGPEVQRPKLDTLDIADRFDVIVYAGYETPAKPDPAPFERALGALDVPAARAVFVGNSLESDVAGGRAAGLTTVWTPPGDVEPPVEPEPDHTLAALPELEGVLIE